MQSAALPLNGAASLLHGALMLQAGRQHVLPHGSARDVHPSTTQVVYSLSKLGVPEALAAGPKTADELAIELGAFVACVCGTITKLTHLQTTYIGKALLGCHVSQEGGCNCIAW